MLVTRGLGLAMLAPVAISKYASVFAAQQQLYPTAALKLTAENPSRNHFAVKYPFQRLFFFMLEDFFVSAKALKDFMLLALKMTGPRAAYTDGERRRTPRPL